MNMDSNILMKILPVKSNKVNSSGFIPRINAITIIEMCQYKSQSNKRIKKTFYHCLIICRKALI